MSEPYFIECSIPSIKYMRGEIVNNDPVNLSLCKSIRRGKYAWYPDNTGKPSIVFRGVETEWVFNNEKERDLEYDRIAKNKFSDKTTEGN